MTCTRSCLTWHMVCHRVMQAGLWWYVWVFGFKRKLDSRFASFLGFVVLFPFGLGCLPVAVFSCRAWFRRQPWTPPSCRAGLSCVSHGSFTCGCVASVWSARVPAGSAGRAGSFPVSADAAPGQPALMDPVLRLTAAHMRPVWRLASQPVQWPRIHEQKNSKV